MLGALMNASGPNKTSLLGVLWHGKSDEPLNDSITHLSVSSCIGNRRKTDHVNNKVAPLFTSGCMLKCAANVLLG